MSACTACGHSRFSHLHYLGAGTGTANCVARNCPCPRYRRPRLAALLRLVGR